MFIELLLLGGAIHSGVNAYKKFSNPSSETELKIGTIPSETKATLETDLCHQQMAEISKNVVQNEITEADKKYSYYLSVSLLALGLTVTGALLFPPLTLLSVPVLIYVSLPIFEDAYMDVFKERKLKI